MSSTLSDLKPSSCGKILKAELWSIYEWIDENLGEKPEQEGTTDATDEPTYGTAGSSDAAPVDGG